MPSRVDGKIDGETRSATREGGVERSDATHPKKKAHLASYYGSKEGFESYLSDASTRTRRTATEVARITN